MLAEALYYSHYQIVIRHGYFTFRGENIRSVSDYQRAVPHLPREDDPALAQGLLRSPGYRVSDGHHSRLPIPAPADPEQRLGRLVAHYYHRPRVARTLEGVGVHIRPANAS